MLSAFDLIYLLTMLLEALRKFGLESDLHLLLLPHLLFPLNAISMMASIYMTVALAVERSAMEAPGQERLTEVNVRHENVLLLLLRPFLILRPPPLDSQQKIPCGTKNPFQKAFLA